MSYTHPGKAFLQIHLSIQGPEDVTHYAEFLRREAGLAETEPAELEKIRARFGIPTPKKARLPNQQGLLLNPDAGLIIINETDIAARQRFTEAHELMELLFDGLPNGQGWAAHQRGPFRHHAKERLCDLGAAHLLIPPAAISGGVSFAQAQKLARRFGVSTTAALVQLVRHQPGKFNVVLWRHKHKSGETEDAGKQLPMFAGLTGGGAPKKLRVEWAVGGPQSPLIPRNKSVPANTAIHKAFDEGKFTTGQEFMDLGAARGIFASENWPFMGGDERHVLSLIEYLGRTAPRV